MKRNRKNVLVIEQSPSLGFVIKTVLNESFNTRVVSNPFDAMDVLSENEISCIILGIDDLNGQAQSFLEHLKSSSLLRSVPLVVLTDIEEETFRDMYGSTQIEKVFKKPFDPLKVLEKVVEVSESEERDDLLLRKRSLLSLN